jgi:hypothetical protein
MFNPSNAELNPICHLLALLGAHHVLHVSRIRVNLGFQYHVKRNAIAGMGGRKIVGGQTFRI